MWHGKRAVVKAATINVIVDDVDDVVDAAAVDDVVVVFFV